MNDFRISLEDFPNSFETTIAEYKGGSFTKSLKMFTKPVSKHTYFIVFREDGEVICTTILSMAIEVYNQIIS